MTNNKLSGATRNKKVILSDETIEMISRHAKMHGNTFSKSIEYLAMSSLRAGADRGIIGMVRSAVALAMMGIHFHFFKLFLFNAEQASIAKETTHAVFIWTLQERYKDYLETLPHGEKPTHIGFQKSMMLQKGSAESVILRAEIQERLGKYRVRGLENLRSLTVEDTLRVFDEMNIDPLVGE